MSHKRSTSRIPRSVRGQAPTVEFVLSAFVLLAIAFATARVFQGMSEAMMSRDQAFQGTRVAADKGGYHQVSTGVGMVQLVGGGAMSTGHSAQSPSVYQWGCPQEATFAETQLLKQEQLPRRDEAYPMLDEAVTIWTEYIVPLVKTASDLMLAADNIEAAHNAYDAAVDALEDCEDDVSSCESSCTLPPCDCGDCNSEEQAVRNALNAWNAACRSACSLTQQGDGITAAAAGMTGFSALDHSSLYSPCPEQCDPAPFRLAAQDFNNTRAGPYVYAQSAVAGRLQFALLRAQDLYFHAAYQDWREGRAIPECASVPLPRGAQSF